MITLIASTTAAATKDFQVERDAYYPPVTIIANGLAAGETVDIQISDDDGATYANLFDAGSQVQVTDTNNAVTLYGPGKYRVSKAATAAAVTVGLSSLTVA